MKFCCQVTVLFHLDFNHRRPVNHWVDLPSFSLVKLESIIVFQAYQMQSER